MKIITEQQIIKNHSTFRNIDVFSTDKVNSHVKLSDKYEDIKSSAATMLIVGGVELVLMALIIAKVIVLPISARNFMVCSTCNGWCFYYFVIAELFSFSHAKRVKIMNLQNRFFIHYMKNSLY